MSKRTRQYIGILSAIVAYYIVHEGGFKLRAIVYTAFYVFVHLSSYIMHLGNAHIDI